MSNATADFTLSGRDIYLATLNAPEDIVPQTLTRHGAPLLFELTFATGEHLVVRLVGNGFEPTSFWLVMASIKRLAELPANWDSYAGAPLNPSAVGRSFSLLPTLLLGAVPEPTVVPTRDGGLQFEWHRRGLDLEVKVPPSGTISYYAADAHRDLEEEVTAVDSPIVRSVLDQLSQTA